MIKVQIQSKDRPIDNLLCHVRIFYKNRNTYGNISRLRSSNSGIVEIPRRIIEENLNCLEYDDIDSLGISLVDPDIIKETLDILKYYSDPDEDAIELELKNRGFNDQEIPKVLKQTKTILKEQSQSKDIFENTKNHFHSKFGFENECTFGIDSQDVIFKL
jgi:hypothetical protein